jgi:hypothetical protein
MAIRVTGAFMGLVTLPGQYIQGFLGMWHYVLGYLSIYSRWCNERLGCVLLD